MKKTFSILLAFILCIALTLCFTGCNKSEDAASEAETTAAANRTDPDAKSLVIYFSRTGEQYGVGVIEKGNTAIVAEMIADEMGADTFEVIPEEDNYPTLNYDALTEVAQKELQEGARPAYKGDVPDLSKYDTIFIGAPVWWGNWPMIMYTLFESVDFSGKTLAPFNTNAGSGESGFGEYLREAAPKATVLDTLAITGTTAQNDRDTALTDVQDWLTELELK